MSVVLSKAVRPLPRNYSFVDPYKLLHSFAPKMPWEMCYSEFLVAASRGSISPSQGNEVLKVLLGTKPLALVHEPKSMVDELLKKHTCLARAIPEAPFIFRRDREKAIRHNITLLKIAFREIDTPWATSPCDNVVYGKVQQILQGLAYGYSINDVCTFIGDKEGYLRMLNDALDSGIKVPDKVLIDAGDFKRVCNYPFCEVEESKMFPRSFSLGKLARRLRASFATLLFSSVQRPLPRE